MPKKILTFIKNNLIGIIFLVIIVAGSILAQFYDTKLIITKKTNIGRSNFSAEVSVGEQPNLNPATESVSEINLKDLDLSNLSESDLISVQAYLKFKKIEEEFFPSGVPRVYGQELNISFDQVQDAINKVAILDPTYGQEGKKFTLTGADLERYIKIGSQTACQYCCGATTLVDKKGVAACGCDHSQMMRGLAAYLIKNHPELSDRQILKELNTWKITYFPKQTLSAKLAEMEKAGEAGIKELLKEFPDFLPQMVGGC